MNNRSRQQTEFSPISRLCQWLRRQFIHNDQRTSLVSVFLTALGAVALVFGVSNLLYFDLYLLGLIELAFFAGIVAGLIDLRRNKAINRVSWLAVIAFGGISLIFYGLIQGAYDASVWLLWFPFVAFSLLGTRRGLSAVAVYGLIVIGIILVNFCQWPSISDVETISNILGAMTAIIWMTFYQARITERAYHRISELAHTDVLTGISNRRSFVQQFDTARAARATRHRRGALLLADIDNFKEINDTHGHAAGDAVIKEVGDRIATAVRQDDIVGRLGGEEFGVLLMDCDVDEAVARADELRIRIAGESIADEFQVTVSIGVASINGSCDEFAAVFAAADEGLYKAKAAGRNRTVFASSR
ncbi:GGDEF domain-containing protein [Aquisalimonas lutea]|uniref:GGDEF domain-containing protein n=1 Tax=Aquisalimonas lutea TaxID=1327750 RepID=UPI0025B56390|nr:GGDEF domain-containing protein [Aquisalimonas lutea]MDN3519710.1 GGDEF domain-containing protein [Aquisalimonas lutea]